MNEAMKHNAVNLIGINDDNVDDSWNHFLSMHVDVRM